MNIMIMYTPDPYTTKERWIAHILIFIMVMGLASWGLSVTTDTALKVMCWLAIASNIVVLMLAVHESVNVNRTKQE